MATSKSIVEYIVDQAADAGHVRMRAMFGEYGVYCDEKIVALVCDDRLFLKPTDAGRAFAGALEEVPAYPGAKPSLVVPEERWDDNEWMAELFRVTSVALPLPKKKPKKKKNS